MARSVQPALYLSVSCCWHVKGLGGAGPPPPSSGGPTRHTHVWDCLHEQCRCSLQARLLGLKHPPSFPLHRPAHSTGSCTSSAAHPSSRATCTACYSMPRPQPGKPPQLRPAAPMAACAWPRYACWEPFSAGPSAQVGAVRGVAEAGWQAGEVDAGSLCDREECLWLPHGPPPRQSTFPPAQIAAPNCPLQPAAAKRGACLILAGQHSRPPPCGRRLLGLKHSWRKTLGHGWRRWHKPAGGPGMPLTVI